MLWKVKTPSQEAISSILVKTMTRSEVVTLSGSKRTTRPSALGSRRASSSRQGSELQAESWADGRRPLFAGCQVEAGVFEVIVPLFRVKRGKINGTNNGGHMRMQRILGEQGDTLIVYNYMLC